MIWTPLALAQPCTDAIPRSTFARTITEAEVALSSVDWSSLQSHAERLGEQLPCAAAPLLPTDVAPYLRIQGWARFSTGDPDAFLWLAAARGVQPLHVYDPPLRGPMQNTSVMAQERWDDHDTLPLPSPAQGEIRVNGAPADSYAEGLPWVFQHLSDLGAVVETTTVDPEAELPSFERAGEASVAPVEPSPPAKSKRHRSRGLLVGGAVTAAAGGGGLLAASSLKRSYRKTGDDGLKAPNAALGGGGLALLGVGAALGTIAVVKGEW